MSNAKTYLNSLNVNVANSEDTSALAVWCQFADECADKNPAKHLSSRGLDRFRRWLRKTRRMRSTQAVDYARRVRETAGTAAGVTYSYKERQKKTFCVCGAASAKAGGLMCCECMASYQKTGIKTRSKRETTPLGILRQAMEVAPASVLSVALKIPVIEIWRRYVGFVEVTHTEAERAQRAARAELAAMVADRASLVDFIHRGPGFVFPDQRGI